MVYNSKHVWNMETCVICTHLFSRASAVHDLVTYYSTYTDEIPASHYNTHRAVYKHPRSSYDKYRKLTSHYTILGQCTKTKTDVPYLSHLAKKKEKILSEIGYKFPEERKMETFLTEENYLKRRQNSFFRLMEPVAHFPGSNC